MKVERSYLNDKNVNDYFISMQQWEDLCLFDDEEQYYYVEDGEIKFINL